MKTFHECSDLAMPSICLAHLVGGSERRLAEKSTLAGTVVDDDRSQALQGHRKHVNMRIRITGLTGILESITQLQLRVFLVETRKYGSSPQWDPNEMSTGFTSRQLDIFHALYGLHQCSDCRSRPPEMPIREEREQVPE
ncbi:MAG: hypothetical protein ABJ056_02870 [Halioglobus sp.]